MATQSGGATPLIANWNDTDTWSTVRVAPYKQFDRWREFVVEAHLHWAIDTMHCDRFPAYIRLGRFHDYRLTHITSHCGGIVGRRGAAEMASDSEALFNLIYIAEGSITLEIAGKPTVLREGNFALWDTTRRMRFITGENLRQITLVMPQDALRHALPRADDYVGRKMGIGESDVNRLLIDHLLSLDRGFGGLPKNVANDILKGAVDLLAATLNANIRRNEESAFGSVLLRQIKNFVVRYLDEPTLTTQRIAEAHRISQRHLNRVFGASGTSLAAWIRSQRLERCRSELIAARDLSISEIAYRWGFSDAGSFSKTFRRQFGMSPRDLRARERLCCPAAQALTDERGGSIPV